MFKHFLITRYNINIQNWTSTKNHELLDNSWMDHRFGLFCKYCYPSVANQSNQDFIWLIFMNSDTEERHKKEILKLVHLQSNIRILFVEGYRQFLFGLQTAIANEIDNEQYLITTRLDNDDCIRKDFIQLIQDEFDMQEKCIIEFPLGLSLEIEPKVRLALRKIRYNPFISLIENVHSYQTVMYYFRHRGWQNSNAKIQSLNKCRPWLQVVHRMNKLNTFKGLILCSQSDLILDFGIALPGHLINPNIYMRVQHFLIVFWNRSIKRIKYIAVKIISNK